MAKAPRATLGDYFTLRRGTTYKSSLLGHPGPVLLGLASIQRNGGFRRDSLQTYGGESPAKLIVQPGELYLSLKDVTQSGDLLGSVARLPFDHPPGRLTQDTVKLEPKSTDVPIDYLYWLLRTPQYRSFCRSHSTGTTNLGLPRDDFLAFPAAEPTSQQLRIAEALQALDDRIELNRRMSETLEAMARALFKSWFVDFEPVRAKSEGCDPGLPQPLADLFPTRLVDSALGEIPAGWEVSTVGDLCDLDKGLSYKGEGLADDGGMPMVNLGCFGAGGAFKVDNIKRYRGDFKKQHVVGAGDLLVANTDMTQNRIILGSPALLPQMDDERQFLFTHHTFAFRFKAGTGRWRKFLYFTLLQPQFREVAEGFATGTTVLALPRDGLLNLAVVLPPDSLLNAFEQQVEKQLAFSDLLRRQSRILASLRDALLPKLISGELRV